MMVLKRMAREPLVHFLVLAALIFSGYQLLSNKEIQSPDRIVVSQARIAQLSGLFQKAWQRPPTAEELKGLVDAFVKEEIYYREAIALGLDKDDTVIRRRLQQKLQFITDLAAEVPSDVELQAYLDKQGDRYALEPMLSFKQIYFNPQTRVQTIDQDLTNVMASLTSNPSADITALGDATMLPQGMEGVRPLAITQTFGSDFAKSVQDAPLATWSGPVQSSYGSHLIFVTSKQSGRLPSLDEVRPAVVRDWTDEKRKANEQAVLEAYKKKYRIEIEPSSPDAGGK